MITECVRAITVAPTREDQAIWARLGIRDDALWSALRRRSQHSDLSDALCMFCWVDSAVTGVQIREGFNQASGVR